MVVFLKAELGFFVLLFSVIFHSTCLVNVLEGGVTSASFSIPCNGQNSCETCLGERWNLVLISVTVQATCFAIVLSVTRCVTRLNVSLTCRATIEKDCGTDYTVYQT